jgi:8-oxo-dGTP pyrophosphatase MutT (NUDIX family)
MSERVPFSTHGFSVVVVRNAEGKWLAVKETRNRGWWLPAGLVDPGEDFSQAAHRECLEEALIRIKLKGILRVEHSVYGPTHARMRVVFYAEPIDPTQLPKSTPDKESEEARWVSLEDLKALAKRLPGLRGPELYEWGSYIEKGGSIAPINFLCREDEPIPSQKSIPTVSGNQDFNSKDIQGFVNALESGNIDIVQKFLISGFNPNVRIGGKDWTPLHLACHSDQEDVVNLLLISGADIDMKTHKNRNVVHFAAQSSLKILQSVIIALYRCPSPVEIINHKDDLGDTPLHFAAGMNGKSESWDLLVEHGADPHSLNMQGITPMDIVAND